MYTLVFLLLGILLFIVSGVLAVVSWIKLSPLTVVDPEMKTWSKWLVIANFLLIGAFICFMLAR